MSEIYYTAPPGKVFDEIKQEAIKIWKTYDNEFGYVDEKVEKIESLKNIRDNAMYMIAMFDIVNQGKMARSLSEESRQEVSLRITAGGTPGYLNPFLTMEDMV